MVHQGGDITMLGHWRIVLKQAEEAARAGHYDEALALASRPDVADHRQAVRLRDQLGKDLLARAGRRGEADDLEGAIADLKLAETHGAPPDLIASSRLQLAEKVAQELRLTLSAGDPARVQQRIEALAKEHVSGPTLRRLQEAAENWTQAQTECQKGEFARAREALDRSERLTAGEASDAIASFRNLLEARQQEAQPKIERLYEALATGNRWGEILAAAENLLDTLPDHPAARQARTRAWQQIGAISPNATIPARTTPAPRPAPRPTEPAPRQPQPDIVFLEDTVPTATCREPNFQEIESASLRRASEGLSGRALLWADAIGGYSALLLARGHSGASRLGQRGRHSRAGRSFASSCQPAEAGRRLRDSGPPPHLRQRPSGGGSLSPERSTT